MTWPRLLGDLHKGKGFGGPEGSMDGRKSARIGAPPRRDNHLRKRQELVGVASLNWDLFGCGGRLDGAPRFLISLTFNGERGLRRV